MIGTSDSSPWLGLVIVSGSAAAVLLLAWTWIRRGYRLKS